MSSDLIWSESKCFEGTINGANVLVCAYDVAHLCQFPVSCCRVWDKWTCKNTGKSLFLSVGLKGSEHADRPVEAEDKEEEQGAPTEDLCANSDHDLSLSEAMDLTANTVPNGIKFMQLDRLTVLG